MGSHIFLFDYKSGRSWSDEVLSCHVQHPFFSDQRRQPLFHVVTPEARRQGCPKNAKLGNTRTFYSTKYLLILASRKKCSSSTPRGEDEGQSGKNMSRQEPWKGGIYGAEKGYKVCGEIFWFSARRGSLEKWKCRELEDCLLFCLEVGTEKGKSLQFSDYCTDGWWGVVCVCVYRIEYWDCVWFGFLLFMDVTYCTELWFGLVSADLCCASDQYFLELARIPFFIPFSPFFQLGHLWQSVWFWTRECFAGFMGLAKNGSVQRC